LLLIEQAAELEHRGGVGHGLTAQIDAHEAAQAGTVVQRLLTSQVSQVEPVLDEVDAQHALQTDGRAPVAGLGVVRFDDFAQCRPRHDGIHGLKELVSPCGLAVVLVSRALIGGHRQVCCFIAARSRWAFVGRPE
jgi:hypothetical protein